jgi:KDO2-lipid IV(A) lauroyltransferase
MTKYWLLRIASWLVPLVPFVIARPLAELGGTLAWMLASGTRRRVERNLRHIPALIEDPAALQRAARGVFQATSLNYLDFFRGARLTNEQIFAGWTVDHEDEIDQAMARGKGLVILTAHFGNFESGASRLGAKGYKVVAPAERLRPEPLFELFCRLREHHHMRLLPADSRETLRDLVAALKNNEIVVIVADRYVTGSSIEVPFFGEPARLPTSAIALAQRTGAPAQAVFSWRSGPTTARGLIVPLTLDTEAEASAGTASTATAAPAKARGAEVITQALGTFVHEMEQVIAAHPEQWVSALNPIWDTSEEQASNGSLADTTQPPAYNAKA